MGYRTLAGPFTFVDAPVRGSRFIGHAAPVEDAAAAAEVVSAQRDATPDASHHTWAFCLRDGGFRHHDDGEPGGSAGRPILAQIEGHTLVDVVVVVVRWFGGTKLGVGGLVRAYGGCAGRTLDRADVVERVPQVILEITHAYDDTNGVAVAIGAGGAEIVDTRWEVEVTVILSVPEPEVATLTAALRDRTSGRVVITPPEG